MGAPLKKESSSVGQDRLRARSEGVFKVKIRVRRNREGLSILY